MECFIIMPRNKKLSPIYDVYKKTCLDLGIKARSVPAKGSIDIIQNTLACIRNSDFAIIDTTGRNPNVMYELGYLMGVRSDAERMILLTQQNTNSIPFDIRHLYSIKYSASEAGIAKMQEELADKIKGIIDSHYTAHNCVYFFYKHLSSTSLDLRLSWDLLSKEFRHRCYNNSFELFQSGFNNLSISNLHIEKITSLHGNNCRFHVSYISYCEVPEIKEMPISFNNTLGDLDIIRTKLKSFRKHLKAQGLNDDFIGRIPLRSMLVKNQEDILQFYLRKGQQLNDAVNIDIFPNTHQVEFACYYEVIVEKLPDLKWYITKIKSLF